MLKCLLVAGAVALITSPALADPYKHESGNGFYPIWNRRDGDYTRYFYGIPRGHLPPPGSCRVWLYDRPPGQQPPPTSCRQAQRLADRYGGRVIWGGEP